MDCSKFILVIEILLSILTLAATNSSQRRGRLVETRDAFNCPSCDHVTCPPVRRGCQLVPEPGICACCLTCAMEEGEHCGLALGRCSRGLLCRPRPFERDPLYALMIGRAVCVSYDYATENRTL